MVHPPRRVIALSIQHAKPLSSSPFWPITKRLGAKTDRHYLRTGPESSLQTADVHLNTHVDKEALPDESLTDSQHHRRAA